MSEEIICKIDNIVKQFPGTTALDHVSFDVKRGEVHAIVGENGAGKSTLMNILSGVFPPTEGTVTFNGKECHFSSPSEAEQAGIAMIHQELSLSPTMTAAENVALPLMFKGMGKKQREKLARKELKKMGLLSRANHKPTEMSGGQQQRVGIARAFVAKPKVIFADEPTGNLDSMTSRQVLYSMLEMAKSYGITFVMVTHEKELAYCGDRIVTIKDGRVLDNVLLGEDEKAENRRRLFGDVTSGDIAEPETTVPEEKKPAARQAKAVAAAVAEKVNQESM